MLQLHFQIHPWLPIINGVQQEDEKIEMVEKGEKNKDKENKKAEKNNTRMLGRQAGDQKRR